MHVKKVTQKDRYGNTMSYEFEVPEKGIDTTKLMEKSMDMMQQMVPPMDHPGEPQGSDTVPAWLTPGEFVVNAEAMRIPGAAEQVESINEMGRQVQAAQGGSIPTYHDGGIIPAPGVSNPETDLGFPFPQRNGYSVGGQVKDKATDLINKMDPAQLVRMMGQISDMYQTFQPAFGLNEGGDVPMPIAPPWSQIPEGTEELLHEREGYVPEIYLDSLGKPTVGYGHLIADEVWEKDDPRIGSQPYSEAELKAFFDKDVQAAQSGAVRNIGRETWVNLNPAQQRALTSMAFQLGEAGQKKFGNMIKAIQAGDHEEAARQALTGSKPGTQSKWLKQTPKRAFDLAEAFAPDVAAQYRAAGGAVYLDDGGWGNWLKGAANKYILGDKNQFDIPEVEATPADANARTFLPPGTEVPDAVPAVEEEEIPYTQTPEFQQHLARIENEAGQSSGDGDDLGTAPTAEKKPSVPPIGGAQDIPPQSGWISPEVEELRMRAAQGDETAAKILDQNHIDPTPSGGGRGETVEGENDRKLWQVENSAEYQAHVQRAATTGEIPDSPEEWLEKNKRGESGQSQIDRFAPYSETVGQTAAAEVIEEGGTADQANAASEAADAALANGASEDEAKEAGKKAGKDKNSVMTTVIEGNKDEDQPDKPSDKGQQTPAEVEDEGNKASPEKKKSAEGFLKGIFGDLFDSKELKRMAIMYLGSRALGYGHGGSIAWAAKQYVGRVDAKAANREKTKTDLLKSGKYDAASIDAYIESGNASDLIPAGVPKNPTGEFKTFFSPNGQRVNAQKYKVGDATVWLGPKGQQIDQTWTSDASMVKGTKEYSTRVRQDTELYGQMIKDLRTQFGTTRDKKGNVSYATEIAPSVEGANIAEWAAKNNVDPTVANDVVRNAYHAAIAHSQATGEKVRDITPFLNDQWVQAQVGDSTLFKGKDGKPLDVVKVTDMFNAVRGVPGAEGLNTTEILQAYRQAWNALSDDDKQLYQDKAVAGENGFMKFVREDIDKHNSAGG